MVIFGGLGRVGRRLNCGVYLLGILTGVALFLVYSLVSGQSVGSNDIAFQPATKQLRQLKRVTSYEEPKQDFPTDAEKSESAKLPLIFIGGMPRSGTTLMRAMLDAHPEIRCGQETHVIPNLLSMRASKKTSPGAHRRMEEAGLTDNVINDAIRSFMLEVIKGHGAAAPRLCTKDPFIMQSAQYLSTIFPNSKFILMLRDGRSVVHSVITRKVKISGFDMTSYRQCLEKWSKLTAEMYQQCYLVGEKNCFPMFYEQLVLHPRENMAALLEFLKVPWNESVLHHEMFIGNEISLSKTEPSSDQVVKPVHVDSLTSWAGHIPADVIEDMPSIAPMLAHIGYDPLANPPFYGEPDPEVLNNTNALKRDSELWKVKIKKLLHRDWEDAENDTSTNNPTTVEVATLPPIMPHSGQYGRRKTKTKETLR